MKPERPAPHPHVHDPPIRHQLVLKLRTLCLLALPLLACGFQLRRRCARSRHAGARALPAGSGGRPRLAALSYDDYRDIRFRPERSRWRDSGPVPAAVLPAGPRHHPAAAAVRSAGRPGARAGGAGLGLPGRPLSPRGVQPLPGAAGWRLSYPLNRADQPDELIVFLGASYFRALGDEPGVRPVGARPGGRHRRRPGRGIPGLHRRSGSSARRPAPREIRFYALLDGPRVTGAYRFVLRPGSRHGDRRAGAPVPARGGRDHARHRAAHQHVPGRREPAAAPATIRPEVHDSDGLLVATGDGEWLWRPLSNPARPFVSSFAHARAARLRPDAARPRLRSYEDLEAHYERRPSAWVEPLGDWGPGRVELLQFAHARRDPRQHRRLLGARTPARAGRAASTSPGACTGRGRAADAPPGAGAADAPRPRLRRRTAAQEQAAAASCDFAGPASRRCPRRRGRGRGQRQRQRARAARQRLPATPSADAGASASISSASTPSQPVELRLQLRPAGNAAYRNLDLCPCPGVTPMSAPRRSTRSAPPRAATAPPIRRAPMPAQPWFGLWRGLLVRAVAGHAPSPRRRRPQRPGLAGRRPRRRRVLLALGGGAGRRGAGCCSGQAAPRGLTGRGWAQMAAGHAALRLGRRRLRHRADGRLGDAPRRPPRPRRCAMRTRPSTPRRAPPSSCRSATRTWPPCSPGCAPPANRWPPPARWRCSTSTCCPTAPTRRCARPSSAPGQRLRDDARRRAGAARRPRVLPLAAPAHAAQGRQRGRLLPPLGPQLPLHGGARRRQHHARRHAWCRWCG